MGKDILDLTVSGWWNRLSEEEQNALITMLYNMSCEDFEAYGIKINKEEQYEYIRP